MLTKTIWIIGKDAGLEVLDETEKAYFVLWHKGPEYMEGRQSWIPKSAFVTHKTIINETGEKILKGHTFGWFWKMLRDEYASPVTV